MHACQGALDHAQGARREPARGRSLDCAPHVAGPRLGKRALREQDSARLLSATLALVAVAAFPAQPADDVKPPPASYGHWFHVNTMIMDKASPLFKHLGGMHNVYVNSVGEAAVKKGGPYPDKSMFV